MKLSHVVRAALPRIATGLAALALGGCDEEGLKPLKECTVEETDVGGDAVNVDELSNFSIAYNLLDRSGTDAVIIDGRPSSLNADEKWRVSSVELLMAVPSDEESFGAGAKVGIRVWDGDDLNASSTPSWTVVKAFDPSSLEWETGGTHTVNLNRCDEADCPDGYTCKTLAPQFSLCQASRTLKTAWLKFDLAAELGSRFMESDRIAIGVVWPDGEKARPLIGASDFDRDCKANWTSFEGGAFEQQSGSGCTWPMIKASTTVTRTTVEQKTDCGD